MSLRLFGIKNKNYFSESCKILCFIRINPESQRIADECNPFIIPSTQMFPIFHESLCRLQVAFQRPISGSRNRNGSQRGSRSGSRDQLGRHASSARPIAGQLSTTMLAIVTCCESKEPPQESPEQIPYCANDQPNQYGGDPEVKHVRVPNPMSITANLLHTWLVCD